MSAKETPFVNNLDLDVSDLQYTDSIKNKFLDLYEEMVIEKISQKNLEAFLSILSEENVTVDEKLLVDEYKKRLFDELSKSFEKMWKNADVANSLSSLKLLKEEAVFDDEQWRPSGKSPTEQTCTYRIKMLTGQIRYLEKRFSVLQEELSSAIVEVEQKREYIENIVRRRNYLSYQIDLRASTYADLNKKMDELLIKINKINKMS